MRPFFIAFCFQDPEYNHAAAAAVSLARPQWQVAAAEEGGGPWDLILTDREEVFSEDPEKSVLLRRLISKEDLLAVIEEKRFELGYSPSILPGRKDLSSCRVTLLTSAAGGQGLSTCSLLLGRYYACYKEERTLLLSFDPLQQGTGASYGAPQVDEETGEILAAEKEPAVLERLICRSCGVLKEDASGRFDELLSAGLRTDAMGLSYFPQPAGFGPLARMEEGDLLRFLTRLAESGLLDRLVLDVPAGCPNLQTLARISEERILVQRQDRKRTAAHGFFEEALKEEGLEWKVLQVHEDDQADGLDLYGQLGWEVMEYAKNHADQ